MKYINCMYVNLQGVDNSCINYNLYKKRYNLPTIPKLVCFIDNIIMKS